MTTNLAGSGTVHTGAVTVHRRAADEQRRAEYANYADYELVDGDGHVFGHTYRTTEGYAGGSWVSHGPAAFSPGHHSLEDAEDVQIAAYVSGAVPVGYRVDVDYAGLSIWETIAEGETRAQSASPIDAGVRAREIEATYRGAMPGITYRVTIICRPCGRQITAFTPDLVERGVPEGVRL